MLKLLTQVKDNLIFFLLCIAIVSALFWLSKLAERFLTIRKLSKARRITITAICSAVATVLHMLDFPLLFLAPDFYRLDFSELPVLLCGFFLGPSAGVACEGIKILLKLLLKGTSTAFVGDFANFAVGCALVLPAITVYHTRKSRASAIWGLCLGTVVLCVFGSLFNAVYLLPKFSQLYGVSLDALVSMGNSVNPGIHSISDMVLLAVVPLNLIKGISVSLLTILLYKRVAHSLFDK